MDNDQLLREMDNKLNDIQGDVNILSTLNKELNKDELAKLIMRKFGSAPKQKLIWYHTDEETSTIQQLANKLDISESSVQNHVSSLTDKGLLRRKKKGRKSFYSKSEITMGIGIKGKIEEEEDIV